MQGKHELKKVAIRLVPESPLYSDQPVRSPEDVVRVLGKELEGYDREVACVVNLQSDSTPINMNFISMGTLNMAPVSAREVFKSAILSNAAGILLLHNHPSGNPTPSRMDIELTENLCRAAQIMDIPLLDHIILGRDGVYCSFRKNGLMPTEEGRGKKAAEKKGSVLECIKECRKKTGRQAGGKPGLPGVRGSRQPAGL